MGRPFCHFWLTHFHITPGEYSSGAFAFCYNSSMEEKIARIKNWLGTGCINIFGLPMSGKDTQGVKLAEMLGAKFISSGMIIREMEKNTKQAYSSNGDLIPSNVFYDWVLPYFSRTDLNGFPLVLSSIGRWSGEENQVIVTANDAGHPIMVAVLLNISEDDVRERYNASKVLNDRGERPDDKDEATFDKRLTEFRTKTMPVLQHYQSLGILVEVNGDQSREAVFEEMINKLAARIPA